MRFPRLDSGLSPELARLIVGQILLHSSMAGMRMAAPLFVLGQGHGKAAAGLLVALFALAQVFLLLPAGRFADRHGLKRPMRWSVAVASIGVGLTALWPLYPMLCLTCALCGGAVGSAHLALQRHVGRAARSRVQLNQAFSWLSIAPAAANFVGPLLAGVAIDLLGFRAAFVLLAVLPLLAWLLVRTANEVPNEVHRPREHGSVLDLLRDPVLRRLLLMSWFVSASWDLHGFMVPVLGHDRALPASAIGGILGVFAVGAVTIRLAMPILGARVREWALITGACAITGVLLLLYPFTVSAFAMGACSAAIGVAVGSVQPIVTAMLHHLTPPHRHGEAIAVRLILINLSSVGMPLLLGAVGGAFGASAVFWSMGLVVGLGSPLGLRLRGVSERVAEH
jgi:MFS family permease